MLLKLRADSAPWRKRPCTFYWWPVWQLENHADVSLRLGEMKGNRASSGQTASTFTKWKMFFSFPWNVMQKYSHFLNELTVLCWLSQLTASQTFQKFEFSKTGELCEISLRHKYLRHMSIFVSNDRSKNCLKFQRTNIIQIMSLKNNAIKSEINDKKDS